MLVSFRGMVENRDNMLRYLKTFDCMFMLLQIYGEVESKAKFIVLCRAPSISDEVKYNQKNFHYINT